MIFRKSFILDLNLWLVKFQLQFSFLYKELLLKAVSSEVSQEDLEKSTENGHNMAIIDDDRE